MKSFKQIAFAAAVLAAPFMAQASMTSMDDSALSSVTGQDGISISGNFGGSVGNVKYTDGDTGGGSLNLTNIGFTGFTISDAAPLKIDVITTTIASVATQQLAITMPTMTGTVTVGGIYVGGTYAAGSTTGAASIGSLAVSDINMAGTTIKVWGH
ncbi:MAG: hypothetical protein K2X80_02360 [Pseudomonadaceae bacterium]|nr:hypothetical protein [Pseudomonadaceae bacterium]